jgi:RNA polymerase sigma factor (sigma-70 family)
MLDAGILTEAYLRFHGPLLQHVRGRIADPEIAADLVQEIFLKAHRSRHLYRPEHAVSTWLWAIAKSLVTDHLRGIRRTFAPTAEPVEEQPCPHPNAERILLSKDRWRMAFRTLRPLTRPQRRVFLLRAFRHLSYEEIATKLGMSLSAVKALAHRARRALEPALQSPTPSGTIQRCINV